MGNLKGTIILTTTHMETVKGRMFGSITQSPIGHLYGAESITIAILARAWLKGRQCIYKEGIHILRGWRGLF